MADSGTSHLPDLSGALPLRTAQGAECHVTSINSGPGAQTNSTQTGGYANQQWNANTINYSTVRSETPPLPHLILPFPRDPNFVHRAELDVLQDKLASRNRVALVGLGGVGKSQLAIEYCYRARELSEDTWVLWIHASNAARYEESMIALAENVKIPGRKDEKVDVLQLVQSWLNNPNKGRWVLVLDNVDDLDFLNARSFSSQGGKRHVDYLPTCSHGKIIITSRDSEVARGLVDGDDTIALSPMTDKAALTLLESRVGQITSPESEDATKLLAALGCMPLAIAQAGSYIRKRAPRCSIKSYFAELEKSEKSKTRLLSTDLGELRRDKEARNSILSTWQISFEHVLRVRPSAAELLWLMSFYDHQSVPDFLLHAARQSSQANPEVASDDGSEDSHDSHFTNETSSDNEFEHEFEDDMDFLRGYDLVSISPDGVSFEMHRLVQFATQRWLKASGRYRSLAAQSISGLDTVLPYGDYGDWQTCQILYPHATLVVETLHGVEQARLDWASTAYKAGWFMLQKASLDEAERFITMSLDAHMEVLEPTHAWVQSGRNGLASVLHVKGEYAAAEEVYKTLQGTHVKPPDAYIYATNRALNLKSLKRYREAEELYRSVIEAREEEFGQDDPHVIVSTAGLAEVLLHQGNPEAAEPLQRRALLWRENKLGLDDPGTLWSAANLAYVLMHLGKYDEAAELSTRALEGRERVYGENHRDTIASMNGLSMIRRRQGRYEESEKLARRALAGSERLHGLVHPEILDSLGRLASILRLQRKDEAAVKICRRLFEGYTEVDGEEDPQTLIASYNLAQNLKDLGRYEEASELMRSCVEISTRVLGVDHPLTNDRENLVRELERKMKRFGGEVSASEWETDSESN